MSGPSLNNLIKLFYSAAVCLVVLVVSGCTPMQTRFGNSPTDYAKAKELPPVKFPPGSLAVSSRYDIPAIPGENKPIITEIVPPDF